MYFLQCEFEAACIVFVFGGGMATETTQVAILKIGSFDQHYDIIFGV